MARVIALPNRLDGDACTKLLPLLVAERGRPVELDGTALCHIGAMGAQFLLAAHSSWVPPDGLRITGLTEDAARCLTDLGIAPEQIGAGPTGPVS